MVVERCGGQVRRDFGDVYALDFGAIVLMATAMGGMSALFAEILPELEPPIVAAYREGAENAGS
ncbi:DUF7697 family protein [Methylobacterium gnaphalii]|uniref:Uncharacterized protein n=1 Tax=Methylobacterium gnaphalii TaxID=1010610 RepID=A0A512JRJ0_9HYPH|nr:hypothetical protein [Methylobacterium gnaphalii]GEP12522.1 hypothetical protein MGN01_43670 [Methylobacterium gnaphalii]GJD70497.1 hypothetical protein MMMDOFMJ_3446 [Methylobacterium gnaphalii]GLS51483.1 hypothetical protein GCM10007885_43400 [Methylobacterium gnaphalii]